MVDLAGEGNAWRTILTHALEYIARSAQKMKLMPSSRDNLLDFSQDLGAISRAVFRSSPARGAHNNTGHHQALLVSLGVRPPSHRRRVFVRTVMGPKMVGIVHGNGRRAIHGAWTYLSSAVYFSLRSSISHSLCLLSFSPYQ